MPPSVAFRGIFARFAATICALAGYHCTGDARSIGKRMGESSLTRWMRALIDYVRSGEPDLTNRQMALLMLVYLDQGPHTVRGLARALNVSKPVVTRALNRLGTLGYLRRQRDDTDKRNIFVARTPEG